MSECILMKMYIKAHSLWPSKKYCSSSYCISNRLGLAHSTLDYLRESFKTFKVNFLRRRCWRRKCRRRKYRRGKYRRRKYRRRSFHEEQKGRRKGRGTCYELQPSVISIKLNFVLHTCQKQMGANLCLLILQLNYKHFMGVTSDLEWGRLSLLL
jgi:hypothetical protein